ncbi:PA2169 family four-helix-bundle protein [Winogradskyella maritima]|nr:PA2169 family four-helix-bundle protein [Winogradskyella maritima]
METKNKNLVDRLGDVLDRNIDAQKGYAKAAENADGRALQAFFQRKSTERESFNMELATSLKTAYGVLDRDGSAKGTLHRAWMDVKNMFSADNDEAMLEECIRGDKAAIEEYTELLEETGFPLRSPQLLETTCLN